MEQETVERVTVRIDQMKKWANKLYFLSKGGLKYASNDYDKQRNTEIKQISESLFKNWKKHEKESNSTMSLKQLKYFISRLDFIQNQGIEFASSDYDIDRYSDVNLICLEMSKVLDKYMESNSKIIDDSNSSQVITQDIYTRFFTDRDLKDEITKLIKEAKNSLLIASPWIDGITEVKDQFIKLRTESKVDIDLLTRPAKPNSKHFSAIIELKRNRINIEIDELVHTKLIIQDETVMYLGSANLLLGSLEKNREAGIITNNPKIVNQGIEYFKDLFFTSGDSRLTI